MLCQDCNKEESTVNLTQIVNNKKIILNLCKSCAEKRGFHSPFENIPFPLADFVTGMMGITKPKGSTKGGKTVSEIKCPSCGLSFEDLGKVGRFGCGKCYSTFEKELSSLLRKIHGSIEHRGKFPVGATDKMHEVRKERKLRDELKRAIEKEDFEQAAVLRDKINSIDEKS